MKCAPVVHQFTAVYAERDAVGQHTAAVDSLLREMGCSTTAFAGHSYRGVDIEVVSFRKHKKYPKPDMVIYQMSTGSKVGDYILARSEPLVLNYHNITPGELFDPWAPAIGYSLTQARDQLALLAEHAYAAIADSSYNAAELRDLGLSNVSVVPVILNVIEKPSTINASIPQMPVLLFVGRIAPNKRLENLIGALALLQRRWKKVQLVIIGTSIVPAYESALRDLAMRLGVSESVEFAGSVPTQVRDTYYSTASIYVSASVHEGFCVPLIEAMSAGLPVVAYASTAVPETIGNAGLLVDSDEPLYLAHAIDRVLGSNGLRSELISKGIKRAACFDPVNIRQDMRDTLESLLENI